MPQIVLSLLQQCRGGKSGQQRVTCHVKTWVLNQEWEGNRECHRKPSSLNSTVGVIVKT
jgi:hypothetical protein